jgi:hypothetical protein
MNKPTTPGHYWLRSYYVHGVTKERRPSHEEIVLVCPSLPPRTRNPDAPKVLTVTAKDWRTPLDRIPDDWDWSPTIPCTLPPPTP